MSVSLAYTDNPDITRHLALYVNPGQAAAARRKLFNLKPTIYTQKAKFENSQADAVGRKNNIPFKESQISGRRTDPLYEKMFYDTESQKQVEGYVNAPIMNVTEMFNNTANLNQMTLATGGDQNMLFPSYGQVVPWVISAPGMTNTATNLTVTSSGVTAYLDPSTLIPPNSNMDPNNPLSIAFAVNYQKGLQQVADTTGQPLSHVRFTGIQQPIVPGQQGTRSRLKRDRFVTNATGPVALNPLEESYDLMAIREQREAQENEEETFQRFIKTYGKEKPDPLKLHLPNPHNWSREDIKKMQLDKSKLKAIPSQPLQYDNALARNNNAAATLMQTGAIGTVTQDLNAPTVKVGTLNPSQEPSFGIPHVNPLTDFGRHVMAITIPPTQMPRQMFEDVENINPVGVAQSVVTAQILGMATPSRTVTPPAGYTTPVAQTRQEAQLGMYSGGLSDPRQLNAAIAASNQRRGSISALFDRMSHFDPDAAVVSQVPLTPYFREVTPTPPRKKRRGQEVSPDPSLVGRGRTTRGQGQGKGYIVPGKRLNL